MLTIHAISDHTIALGREGENLARQVVFDISEWQASYGDGTVSLIAQRNGDAEPYPCTVTVDGSSVTWKVMAADTVRKGYGKCELRYTVGDVLVKSETWPTCTADALGTPAPEPPEPAKNWVDAVLKSSSDAKQSATESAESAKQAAVSSTNAANSANEAQKSREAIENMEVAAISLSPDSTATVEKAIADGKVKLTFGIPKGERDIFWLNTASSSKIAETFDEIVAAYKAGKSIWIRDTYTIHPNVATAPAYLVRPIYDDNDNNINGILIVCGGSAYGSSEIGAADALMNVTYYIHASPEEVTFEQLISVAAEWQDMSPLIVNIMKDGQDESGEPLYKSDKTFDEIKEAYDTGREIKLGEIGDLNSEMLQAFCGSEPRLLDVSDDEAIFFCVGTATALFNNEFNSMASYGGIPTFMIIITINKSSDGDVVNVESNFRIDEEAGRVVFEPEEVSITKLSPSSGAEVFYIDLAGNYPNYTCPVAVADIKAAYEAGKVLECRCMLGQNTATMPLFGLLPDANLWIFSGAGTFKEIGFKSQTFTVVIGDGFVLADNTQLVDVNDKLPNPHSLTIISGGDRVTYDGSEPVHIDIPASGDFVTKQEAQDFASKQEAQGYVTAHNEDTAAHQDIRTALSDEQAKWDSAATKPKACLVILGSSDWDATAKTQVVNVSSVVADEATQMIHTKPKIGQITDYNNAGIQLVGRGAGNVTFMCDTIPEKDIEVWVVTEDVEDVTPLPYLTFSSPQPFTLKAASGKQWNGTLEYSYDTSTWTTWDGSTSLQPPEGYRLYMRGIGNTKITGFFASSRWELTGTDIACTGNIENLLDYTVVRRGKHPVMAAYCYSSMFSGCTSLTTAPELPATTLTKGCYDNMFERCVNLTTAPELPATTLAAYCYDKMFRRCVRLTTAPELPATTLAEFCYDGMFEECYKLATAPELPATTLAQYCYSSMFNDCALTTAPELPATTLANNCYDMMFGYCRNLTTAPELPATTLATGCYLSMFIGCTSLTTAPELPATTLAAGCYGSMFEECRWLTTAPSLPATTLAKNCYAEMFYNCERLTTAPELPATTLANDCYRSMFQGCSRLTTAPELPATTLATNCYHQMFQGCSSLATAPSLPATTLATNCYSSMFYSCTSLTTAPSLPATTLADGCYDGMFYKCRSLKLSTTATDPYTIAYRIPSVGEGTSGQDSLTDMFTGTGGTFVGTPEINTTYYLDKSNSIA